MGPEGVLEIRGPAREGAGALPDGGLQRLGRVSDALGSDANLMERLVGRRGHRVRHRPTEPPPPGAHQILRRETWATAEGWAGDEDTQFGPKLLVSGTGEVPQRDSPRGPSLRAEPVAHAADVGRLLLRKAVGGSFHLLEQHVELANAGQDASRPTELETQGSNGPAPERGAERAQIGAEPTDGRSRDMNILGPAGLMDARGPRQQPFRR